MKRLAVLLVSVLFLTACGAEQTEERAERLQRKYDAMAGCEASLSVHVVQEEETRCYTLELSRSEDKTRVTVLEPEELAGISATVDNDDTMTLEYDGMVLDAGSADPVVSGANAAPLFFRAVKEGYVLERSVGRWMDTDNALRLCFELELDGAPLLIAAWFNGEDEPLYAELERGGEIVAYLEFTDFEFGAILDTD